MHSHSTSLKPTKIFCPHNEMHFTSGIPMNKYYSIGTNRTNHNQWTRRMYPHSTSLKPTKIFCPHNEMHFTSGIPMNKYYSIGTNRTNHNQWTRRMYPHSTSLKPTKIFCPHNEMHFTNIPLVPIVPIVSMDEYKGICPILRYVSPMENQWVEYHPIGVCL